MVALFTQPEIIQQAVLLIQHFLIMAQEEQSTNLKEELFELKESDLLPLKIV